MSAGWVLSICCGSLLPPATSYDDTFFLEYRHLPTMRWWVLFHWQAIDWTSLSSRRSHCCRPYLVCHSCDCWAAVLLKWYFRKSYSCLFRSNFWVYDNWSDSDAGQKIRPREWQGGSYTQSGFRDSCNRLLLLGNNQAGARPVDTRHFV